MLSQSSPHCPYATNSLFSPLVSVAQILPSKLALVVMLEHLLYIVPSKVNGKMHSWLGFWLIKERLGDVLHVSGLAEKKEKYFFNSEKCQTLIVDILLKTFQNKEYITYLGPTYV